MFVAVFSKRHPIFIRPERQKKSAEERFPLPIFLPFGTNENRVPFGEDGNEHDLASSVFLPNFSILNDIIRAIVHYSV